MDVRGAAIPDRSIAFNDAWASRSCGRCRSETKASTTSSVFRERDGPALELTFNW